MKRIDGKDGRLEGSPHPPIEALLALTGEKPAPGEPAADSKWMEHIDKCPSCSELFQELKTWRDAVRQGDAGSAPEAWVRRAEEHATPRSFMTPLSGTLRADVVFDSAMMLAAGTRADALQGRQWVLAIDRLEIEISLTPSEANETPPLTGQILQIEGAPVRLDQCRVFLLQDGREMEETSTLETGEFLFGHRPSGSFQLRVDGEGWSVQTPLLEP